MRISHLLRLYVVSQDPNNYRDAPTEGIRRVLEIVTGAHIPRGDILSTDKIGVLPMIISTFFFSI